MCSQEDQPYIDRVLQGDTRAFSVLVDRYKHMVFTLAVKITRNREEAEEVAQDVFLKVYQVLHTFQGSAKFSTWIYRITYNRALDYLKKKGRHLNTVSNLGLSEYDVPSMDYILDSLEKKDRSQCIKEAMRQLPEEDSIVLTLYYFEELSLKEIGSVMELGTANIKVRLFRARKRLATLLQYTLEPETLKIYGNK